MVDSLWYTAGSDRTPLKLFLNIDSADTADDAVLDNFGVVANRIIDNEIFPYKDDIPETSTLSEDLQELQICTLPIVTRFTTRSLSKPHSTRKILEVFWMVSSGD